MVLLLGWRVDVWSFPLMLWWWEHPDLQVREIGGTRFCGDTKKKQIPFGNDRKKSKNVVLKAVRV